MVLIEIALSLTDNSQSFSAIVGPNGSGKSNTIDALLFVFGYRASKMRQGKLSELIHNSANYPDLDDCRVEVHFREIFDLVCLLLNNKPLHRLAFPCSPAQTHSQSSQTQVLLWLEVPTRIIPQNTPLMDDPAISVRSLPCSRNAGSI
jgi:ABC-type lipoprotein export system ATPase subunit